MSDTEFVLVDKAGRVMQIARRGNCLPVEWFQERAAWYNASTVWEHLAPFRVMRVCLQELDVAPVSPVVAEAAEKEVGQ